MNFEDNSNKEHKEKEILNTLNGGREEEPKLYRVVLMNDDFTPMEFVIRLLEELFYMSRIRATEIMLKAHVNGKAECGIYTYEVAETKIAQVVKYTLLKQQPVACNMEVAN